jgi:2-methylcitrate dehydratase PrpD
MAAYPATERIASFVAKATLDSVPPAAVAVAVAKIAITDNLSVALAGSQNDAGTIAARVAREEGAPEEACVLGHGFRASRGATRM